jgi:hypothetical protein
VTTDRHHQELFGPQLLAEDTGLAAADVFSPAGSARETPVFPTILTMTAEAATNRMNFVDILISPFAELF